MELESKGLRRKSAEAVILQTAEIVFAERGYAGTTITEIANRCNLPKTNIHYYFGKKETLYRRVLFDVLDAWIKAGDKFNASDNPKIIIGTYINTKMDLSRNRPNGSRIWANEILNNAPIAKDFIQSELRDWVLEKEKCINDWIREGLIRPISAKHLLYMIWATTQHYADFSAQIDTINENKPLSDEDFNAAKKTITSIILNGILVKNE